jgi:ABC-type lipoprotein export system ATPase subunit
LVIVTHDLELSRRAHRIIHLAAGRVDRIEVISRSPGAFLGASPGASSGASSGTSSSEPAR